MALNDSSRKTLPATLQHRRRARAQGKLPRAPLLGPSLAILALPLVVVLGLSAVSAWMSLVQTGLSFQFPHIGIGGFGSLFLPIILGPCMVALGLFIVQGLSLRWPLRLNALSPLTGFTRIFSRQALAQAGVSAGGFILLLTVLALVVPGLLDGASLAPPAGFTLGLFGQAAVTELGALAAIGIVMAIISATLARRNYERDIKMTPEEFREDLKANEGDPLVRRRWAQIRRAFYTTRLQAQLARADVVIVNPTHYAIALSYEPWRQDAPEVVARGRNERARRIREIAQELGVPLVEAPPLAQDLYRSSREGQTVPGRLFQAVAEILAYLHRTYGYTPRTRPVEGRGT